MIDFETRAHRRALGCARCWRWPAWPLAWSRRTTGIVPSRRVHRRRSCSRMRPSSRSRDTPLATSTRRRPSSTRRHRAAAWWRPCV